MIEISIADKILIDPSELPNGHSAIFHSKIDIDGSNCKENEFLSIYFGAGNMFDELDKPVTCGTISIGMVKYDFVGGHTVSSYLKTNETTLWIPYLYGRIFSELPISDIGRLFYENYAKGLDCGRCTKEREIRKVLGLES